jgi:HAD superfamily hydrolase (TIGR01509 family)
MKPKPGKLYVVRFGITDFDGTIANSEGAYLRAWNTALARFGKRLGMNDYLPFCGKSGMENAHTICRMFSLPVPPEKLYEMRTAALLVEFRSRAIPPMRGAEGLSLFFRRHGVPLAIATAGVGEENRVKLGAFPLAARFSFAVTGDEVERLKPYPDLYLLACAKQGAAPGEAVAFEDSVSGVMAARDAGLLVFGIPTKYSAPYKVKKLAGVAFGSLVQAVAFMRRSVVETGEGYFVLRV